jgi:hypothetical protein
MHDPRVYPPRLQEEEAELIEKRHRAAGSPGLGGWFSLGLSGGGIRSATFGLGVFQAWAQSKGFLRRIDYVSTVSGGGYLGSFLGRLLSRTYIDTPEDFEAVLRGEKHPEILRSLRENGRYMSPNGSGDKLLAGAVVLRNWVSMHLVLAIFLMLFFLALQLVRFGFGRLARIGIDQLVHHFPNKASLFHSFLPDRSGTLWWSPFILIPPFLFLLLAFPLGWAFWLIEPTKRALFKAMRKAGQRPRRHWDKSVFPPWLGVIFTFLIGIGLSLCGADLGFGPYFWPLVAALGGTTLFWWTIALLIPLRDFPDPESSGTDSTNASTGEQIDIELHRRLALRSRLSLWLTWALTAAGILLALAVIDSLGQSFYAHWRQLWAGVVALVPPLVAAVGAARRITVLFAPGPNQSQRPRLSLELLATAASLILAALLLILIDAASHAIAWKFEDAETESRQFDSVAVGFLVALVLSYLFGRTWPFVNRSSHHSLYASRLTRAYLGASNLARTSGHSITQVMLGDDVDMARYWPPPERKATPLHLINVTINETVDGRSQVQQEDRKGIGMALGPCGLSVGAEHHAVIAFGKDNNADPYGLPVTVYPSDPNAVRVFRYERKGKSTFRGEPLTLGDWVGISGAAFSTGLGAQTSFGISMLAGLTNVRLGLWWDSGVAPVPRQFRDTKLGVWIESVLERIFPVQISLLDEFLARFPGTARRYWYVSDGGHFENLGGYELIRRRAPLIVIVDAEQDTDFRFGGLSNLVRKARLDFGAEIEFLERAEIEKLFPPESRQALGTLDQLRRGRWEGDSLKEASRTGLSKAHAALAWVRYGSPPALSRLVYIKPSLTGDEPADVLEYHRSHPDFPHESTGDQFFDEGQWESYRRLGEHIAEQVLPFLEVADSVWKDQ